MSSKALTYNYQKISKLLMIDASSISLEDLIFSECVILLLPIFVSVASN